MQLALRQPQIFVAACDEGSLTDAAEWTGIAQSGVSTAVKVLERPLGTQLLVRVHATGFSPTPEGRQLLGQARTLLESSRELERSPAISGPRSAARRRAAAK
jgi:DNA-binding transcriptional LysR family regulator